ncbi:hypothetical protein BKA70DRAFT_1238229 [Coprinopsis sp. MPI-PUGE-AT-0042]|nr:hypothetical protein BKA70DRAFT_1238229 [Coprinopsis sp. MPI-PUGE-AT-0042]
MSMSPSQTRHLMLPSRRTEMAVWPTRRTLAWMERTVRRRLPLFVGMLLGRTQQVTHPPFGKKARPASPISIKSNFPSPDLPSDLYDDLVEDEMSFTFSMGDRRASVVVTGPLGPRVPCCGQTFPSDVSFLSTDTGSIESLAESLNRPTSHDGFVQKLTHMAIRGQSSCLSMDLARLQLKIALATYMDRVDDFETEHTLIHQTLHEISLPTAIPIWYESNRKIEQMSMRRLPQIAGVVGDNLSLLRPYTKHLKAVRCIEDLQSLEARVDQIFSFGHRGTQPPLFPPSTMNIFQPFATRSFSNISWGLYDKENRDNDSTRVYIMGVGAADLMWAKDKPRRVEMIQDKSQASIANREADEVWIHKEPPSFNPVTSKCRQNFRATLRLKQTQEFMMGIRTGRGVDAEVPNSALASPSCGNYLAVHTKTHFPNTLLAALISPLPTSSSPTEQPHLPSSHTMSKLALQGVPWRRSAYMDRRAAALGEEECFASDEWMKFDGGPGDSGNGNERHRTRSRGAWEAGMYQMLVSLILLRLRPNKSQLNSVFHLRRLRCGRRMDSERDKRFQQQGRIDHARLVPFRAKSELLRFCCGTFRYPDVHTS